MYLCIVDRNNCMPKVLPVNKYSPGDQVHIALAPFWINSLVADLKHLFISVNTDCSL